MHAAVIPEPKIALKLKSAIQAMLAATGLPPAQGLQVLRSVAEELPTASGDVQSDFEKVKLRSLGVENEILQEEGGQLSDAEFAKRLGIASRETIRRYREKREIFAIERGQRNLSYPAWQIYKRKLLPGLTETLALLHEKQESGFGIAIYFLGESDELDGKRPLDLLRDNQVDAVLEHARRYGAMGA